jgi:polyphosphate kinase
LTDKQRLEFDELFEEKIFPSSPLADPAIPFYISNRSLNLAVSVRDPLRAALTSRG